jgi:superoxide dismutase
MRLPRIASFLLFFFLAACAAPTAVPPTATLAPMQPTATLEPSPTATQSAPKVEAIDPLAWQSFGSNSEIVATGADLTLWDGMPQEQKFIINPENAEKLHEGLFTFAAMINWHGNEAIRNQYANFMQYEQYLKTHPEQVDWTIVESNYHAGNRNSRNQGKFVKASKRVDLNQFAVALEDTDDTPEGEGWVHMGAGVVFKMRVIQTESRKNVIQFSFSDRYEDSIPDMADLGLSKKNDVNSNSATLVQVLNYSYHLKKLGRRRLPKSWRLRKSDLAPKY